MLLFYVNRDDAKDTVTGDFFAGTEKENVIAPYIFNLNNGEFAVVYDKGVMLIDIHGNEIWNETFLNRIVTACITEGKRIVLALGEETAVSDLETYKNGTICILDRNGNRIAKYEMGDDISYINVVRKNIIAGSGKNFVCLSNTAKEVWKYTAKQDIKDIFPYNNGKSMLVITSSEAKVVDIQNK